MYDEWESECNPRINYDVSGAVGGKSEAGGPAVSAIGDPFHVIPNHLGELVLAGADHHQLEELVRLAPSRVVIEHLRAIRVQVFESKCVLDTDRP
jgi:hypothetical protein